MSDDKRWQQVLKELLEEFILVEEVGIDPPYDAVWRLTMGIEQMNDFVDMGALSEP